MQSNDNSTVPMGESSAADDHLATSTETGLTAAGPSTHRLDHAGDRVLNDDGEKPEETDRLPVLPADGGDDPGTAELLRVVRSFHRGQPGTLDDLRRPGERFVPALLHQFRDRSGIRNDYPLFLFPPDKVEEDRLGVPLPDLLEQLTAQLAPDEAEWRILKDNLRRVERYVRDAMIGAGPTVDASTCLAHAARAVEEGLALSGDSAQQLHDSLEQLFAALPEGGKLLDFGRHTMSSLFVAAARHHAALNALALKDDVTLLNARLRDMLLADAANGPQAGLPEALGSSVGEVVADHFNADVLADVLGPARGVESMSASRRSRIERACRTFDQYLSAAQPPRITVIHDGTMEDSFGIAEVDCRQVAQDAVCAAATAAYDDVAAEFAQLFGAIRVAHLELAGAYDPSRHDALLDAFHWRAFSAEERRRMPPILAVAAGWSFAGAGIADVSRLLRSGRPVRVMALVDPMVDPSQPAEQASPADGRFELGYLGVSHRTTLVHQSSPVRPEHLLEGFLRGLVSTGSALHVVAHAVTREEGVQNLVAFHHLGAAMEARAHPFFCHDPEAGSTWSRRFEFTGNPQLEADWPEYHLACQDAQGQKQQIPLAFTFADCSLLEPQFSEHFRVIPASCSDEKLVPVSDYLKLSSEQAADHLPYIWAVDEDAQLHRLVVSYDLVCACEDRLDYWHTLQELAGIRNAYVRDAIESERERLISDFETERQGIVDAHAAELQRVRAETGRETMERLAQALLGMDTSSVAALASDAAGALPVSNAPPAPTQETAHDAESPDETDDTPAVVDADVSEEPWISSALCTSCNDCMDINAQMFVYDGNKQATIGDPRAGTFAQLVRAAEKCPARCIHPGKPLNTEEPDLKKFIERAKPFQ